MPVITGQLSRLNYIERDKLIDFNIILELFRRP